MSTFGSIGRKMTEVFQRKKAQEPEAPLRPSGSGSGGPPRISTDGTTSTASTVSLHSERAPTPILDPSTNTNPLLDLEENRDHPDPAKGKPRDEMSKHIFYIQNGQMKLKISAKNERQMLQWIAALEKATSTCHFSRRSRFDSLAPIRLNVAAQWLVDGVSSVPCVYALSEQLQFQPSVTISRTFHVLYCSRRNRFTSMAGGCPLVIRVIFTLPSLPADERARHRTPAA